MFTGETVGVRLNTDLELVYDITFDESNWSSTCTIGTDCATANTYDTVATYASVITFKILFSINKLYIFHHLLLGC